MRNILWSAAAVALAAGMASAQQRDRIKVAPLTYAFTLSPVTDESHAARAKPASATGEQ